MKISYVKAMVPTGTIKVQGPVDNQSMALNTLPMWQHNLCKSNQYHNL